MMTLENLTDFGVFSLEEFNSDVLSGIGGGRTSTMMSLDMR
jgi:hypothetical protein